jgi:hypothetical protein
MPASLMHMCGQGLTLISSAPTDPGLPDPAKSMHTMNTELRGNRIRHVLGIYSLMFGSATNSAQQFLQADHPPKAIGLVKMVAAYLGL